MKLGYKENERIKKPILSLKKNFSWTLVGNIVAAICKWLILVVIAKVGSATLLGQFTLGYAITSPVFMFTNLQLRAIQATDVKEEYEFSDYFKLRFISNIIGLLFIIFVLLPVFNYNKETFYIIIVVGLVKLIESFSDVFYGQMQRKERMDLVSKSMMIREIIGLCIFILILMISNNLLYSLLGFLLIYLFIVLKYDIVVSLKLESTKKIYTVKEYGELLLNDWDLRILKKLTFFALPLGLGVFLGSLVTNVPRYLVEYYLGNESLGYFAAIAYFGIGFSTFFSALGQTARPRLSNYYEGNFSMYKGLLGKLLVISSIFGISFFLISLVLGKEILSIMYSPAYSQYWNTLIWVSLAVFLQSISSVLQIAIQSARVFNVQIFISIISLISATIAGYWLIPHFGVEGAGITLLISSIINTLVVMLFFLKFVYFKKLYNSEVKI